MPPWASAPAAGTGGRADASCENLTSPTWRVIRVTQACGSCRFPTPPAWSSTCVMRRLLLLLLLAAGAVGSPACAEPPSPELMAQLRQGGQVIFLRHAFADEGIDEDPKTLGPCQRQR